MKSKDFEIRTPFLGVGDPLQSKGFGKHMQSPIKVVMHICMVIAFTELVAFMEDLQKEYIAPVFKLTDLAFMYTRLNLSSLVMMLKAGYTLQGSKKYYYQYIQIFTHIHKANV